MSTPPATADQLRSAFLDFFAAKGHSVVPSASLIPHDPTVLFTVAGMVPLRASVRCSVAGNLAVNAALLPPWMTPSRLLTTVRPTTRVILTWHRPVVLWQRAPTTASPLSRTLVPVSSTVACCGAAGAADGIGTAALAHAETLPARSMPLT